MENENDGLAHYKAHLDRHAIMFDQYKTHLNQFLSLYQAVTQYAASAIKSVIFLNGTAAIAFLALIGNLSTAENDIYKSIISNLIPALSAYAYGAFVGGLTAGIAYIAQYFFSRSAAYTCERVFEEDKTKIQELTDSESYNDRMGSAFQIAGLVLGFFGLFCFLIATSRARDAFLSI